MTTTVEGAPAPAAPPPVAAPPAAPPLPPPLAATPQPGDENQPWFKERLARSEEQARARLLADLGVDDPEKAKKAIADAKKAEEDAKSTAEKLGETTKELKSSKARVERLEKVTSERATAEMARLNDTQRAAVTAIAGDDPASQLQAITQLLPTWAGAAPPVVPPPATTMPPQTAPSGTTTSPPDRKAEYARLKSTNPHAAAVYLNTYANEIYPRA